jgi:hypothetical protein
VKAKKKRKRIYVGYGNFDELPKWDMLKKNGSKELGGFVMPCVSLTKNKTMNDTKIRITYEEI